MSERPSNGEYKYQREENSDSKVRVSSEKDRDEKEHQVDKAGEYVRELLQEKVELDSQKWPNATRLIDQGKCYCCYHSDSFFNVSSLFLIFMLMFFVLFLCLFFMFIVKFIF